MLNEDQMHLPNVHFFRVLNLALCCGGFLRDVFLLSALSPCKLTGATFYVFSSNSLLQQHQTNQYETVPCSIDGNHWVAEIKIRPVSSFFVKMS